MIFAPAPSRWFTIPAHRPFVDDLAAGLQAALAPLGPEALSDALVLTPTKRGARAVAEAFVKAAEGRAVLLPQIRAVGELDEGEPPFEPGDLALDLLPAITPLRRRFELARLVLEHAPALGRPIDTAGALELADALTGFVDSADLEEVALPAEKLDALAPDDLAQHWRRTAEFLKIAAVAWPARLVELGLADVNARRIALLRGLAAQWRERPPTRPLIAAGSTGSAPATADLLRVIAQAPQGAVVLPGLDQDLAQDAWEKVADAHPQGGMRRLLERAGVARGEVAVWPASLAAGENARGRWRRRVVNEALRPAEATADWRVQIGGLRKEGESEGVDAVAEGLRGLTVLSVRHEEEAACAVALMLRETLETPGLTAALITPDQSLARRVSARLTRWGVAADSSAGSPLAGFPVGVLTSLLARAGAEPLEPARTLALLKHGFTRVGHDRKSDEGARRELERRGFRGPRRTSWEAVDRAVRQPLSRPPPAADTPEKAGAREARCAAALDLSARFQRVLAQATAPFAAGPAPLPDAARALTCALEALAADETGHPRGLWSGPEGEAAASLLAGLISEGAALPPVDAAGFADVIERLVDEAVVRSAGATHSRLRILGAIEARLVRADRLILAGLEEGVWPRAAETDPFLSRPMRAALGLPPPERRVGLSAHDFAQAACAPDVTLVSCERRGGQPAVPSRWLWRLRTLARGTGLELPDRPEVLGWARALEAPLSAPPPSLTSAPRPCPTPPVAVRPTALAVTRVEQWVRDPYALYARMILNLSGLDRPDEPVEARLRGTAVHAAFEAFAKAHPEVLPEDAEAIFRALLVGALTDAGMPQPRMAREHALADRLAPWVIDFERTRRRDGARLLIEQEGEIEIPVDGAPFRLRAKADRLEARVGGSLDILDFKTGAPPARKQVEAGFSPQLTLTAAIVARGGFADAGRRPGQLVYVQVSGTRTQADPAVVAEAGESAELAERAMEGLVRRIRAFREPDRGYPSKAAPQFINLAGDYDHLARVFEWHVMGEADGEGGGAT